MSRFQTVNGQKRLLKFVSETSSVCWAGRRERRWCKKKKKKGFSFCCAGGNFGAILFTRSPRQDQLEYEAGWTIELEE